MIETIAIEDKTHRDYRRAYCNAIEIAKILDGAERLGADEDTPEGSRYIIISDTLAKQLSEMLLPKETFMPSMRANG